MRKYHLIKLLSLNRHQIQILRKLYLAVISIILLMAVSMSSVSLISISTQAGEIKSKPAHKYYKSIEITKGDTLWSIAKDNIDTHYYKNVNEYINEIKTMNSIKSDHIVSGSYIIIPYYSLSDFSE